MPRIDFQVITIDLGDVMYRYKVWYNHEFSWVSNELFGIDDFTIDIHHAPDENPFESPTSRRR